MESKSFFPSDIFHSNCGPALFLFEFAIHPNQSLFFRNFMYSSFGSYGHSSSLLALSVLLFLFFFEKLPLFSHLVLVPAPSVFPA